MTAPLVCWHVGRKGEVAGGMTQVVNAYLAWTFEKFDVRVLVSRDGSKGVRALRIFAQAVLSMLRMKNRESTVVVVHLAQGGSFVREGLLLRLAHRRGFATVAHLHGSSFVDFARSKPGLVKKVLGAADRVLVLSDATREAVEALVPAERVSMVVNAVPAGADAVKTHSVVFGGSVSHRKGVDVLTKAWAGLADRGWHLEIVGPVKDQEVVDSDLASATWHGALPHARLMELLESASIAVLPSRDEAMPMFILEAMARKAAVVATDVGGIAAVLSEGAGVVVEPGDVDGLREALAGLIDSEQDREQTAQAGNARFRSDFSAEALYPRLEQLWLSVLTARASGAGR